MAAAMIERITISFTSRNMYGLKVGYLSSFPTMKVTFCGWIRDGKVEIY